MRSGILVMSTLGVGDVLMAQPLLEAIRSATQERLVVLARAGSPAQLARRLGCADLVVDYVARWPHRLWGGLRLLPWVARQRFRLVMATTGLNPYYASLVALASKAPTRIGERRGRWHSVWTVAVDVDENAHVVERNRALGRAAGIDAGTVPRFAPNAVELARARELLAGCTQVVALSPGSNKEIAHKRWPEHRFAALASGLIDRGLCVVLMGGPDEGDLGRRLEQTVARAGLRNLVGRTDVGTAAAVLSMARAAVGNDGMLLHLAAAVGTPTVAIFGPSDHRLYAPRGRRGVVVREEVPCAPCDRRLADGCARRHCLANLEVERVMEAVEAVLGSPDTRG